MHRIAIGDPQCVCHELFAQLRIRMVDGESVWQQFYPHASGSLGSSGCGHCRCLVEVWNCVHVDISSGTRIAKRARFDNAQAIVRCGEPVQLQLWVRIFCLRSRSGLIIEWQRRKRTFKRGLACCRAIGAPRPMKMGTIASPWRHDAAFCPSMKPPRLRSPIRKQSPNDL